MAISISVTDHSALRKCCIPFAGLRLLLMSILIHNNTMHTLCSNDYEFVTQPSDVTIREGESTSFVCTLQTGVPFASVSSYWINGKTENVQQKPFVNITTQADIEQKQITSRLAIQIVTREMDALYKCSIVLIDPPGEMLSSDFARLNVLYFVRETELLCSGPVNNVLEDGDRLGIQCEAYKSNPPATLRWLWPNSTSVNASSLSPVASSILVANLTVTRSLHNGRIICLATSRDFPGRSVNCSLGPFEVPHPPLVKVIPYQADMSWPLVASMSFQCLATGYPEVVGYNWYCSPGKAFAQCSSHSQNLTIVVHPVQDAEVLNVTCEARNPVGSSRDSSPITVRHGDEALLPDCESSTLHSQERILEADTFLDYDVKGHQGYLKCSTKVRSTDNITFRWSLSGIIIFEEQGKYVLGEDDNEGTHLIAYSMLEMMGPGIVTCDYRSRTSVELQRHQVSCYSFAGTLSSSSGPPINHLVGHHDNSSKKPLQLPSTTSVDISTLNSTDISGTFWMVFWKSALAIATVLGILLCATLVALGWRKLMARERYETEPSAHAIHLSGSNDTQSTVPQSELGRMNTSPLYEVPNDRMCVAKPSVTDPFPMATRSSDSIHRHIRGDVDSVLEDDESSSDCRRSGCSFSSTDVRMSYIYEDTGQGEAEALHHYENRQVVESVIGKAGSKYYLGKVTENERKCEHDVSLENDDESSSCLSEELGIEANGY